MIFFRILEVVTTHLIKKLMSNKGYPGGSVVKNMPADTGDMGLIPGLGRSHVPQSN